MKNNTQTNPATNNTETAGNGTNKPRTTQTREGFSDWLKSLKLLVRDRSPDHRRIAGSTPDRRHEQRRDLETKPCAESQQGSSSCAHALELVGGERGRPT